MSGRLGRSSQAIASEPTPNATMSAAKIATGTYPDTRLLLWWGNRSGSRVYSTRGRTGNRRLIPGTHVRRRGADRAQKSGLRRGMRVALSWGYESWRPPRHHRHRLRRDGRAHRVVGGHRSRRRRWISDRSRSRRRLRPPRAQSPPDTRRLSPPLPRGTHAMGAARAALLRAVRAPRADRVVDRIVLAVGLLVGCDVASGTRPEVQRRRHAAIDRGLL